VSCDLLENSYICSIANNLSNANAPRIEVVICLKTRTFAVSQTTPSSVAPLTPLLWFAWKLVHLQYRKQRRNFQPLQSCVVICLKTRTFAVSQTTQNLRWKRGVRCDLLENSYICSIANNVRPFYPNGDYVVICLKTRTFAVSQTTRRSVSVTEFQLWFAWKLVHLQYRKQHTHDTFLFSKSCDLLENSYICSIANNRIRRNGGRTIVVICLKTRTFAVSQTTHSQRRNWHYRLWFAWKLVHLQYRKQHTTSGKIKPISCDLLENSYICSIANNSLLI